MGEAVLIAWAEATKAVAEMVTEIVKGQPDDVRKAAWEWWKTDQERWRRWLHLDDPKA